MNRRAFFSALAGAPVAVVAGSSAQATQQSWPSGDLGGDHGDYSTRYVKPYIDRAVKCSCGSSLFHSTHEQQFIRSKYGVDDYYIKQACSWCGKVRAFEEATVR